MPVGGPSWCVPCKEHYVFTDLFWDIWVVNDPSKYCIGVDFTPQNALFLLLRGPPTPFSPALSFSALYMTADGSLDHSQFRFCHSH